jgi:predicted ATPase
VEWGLTDEKLSHYWIIGEIGHGGMGTIYRARDERLGRDVALKLLPKNLLCDPLAVERFDREARAASALNHPNIVTIYEIGEAQSARFIAMELVEGATLRALARAGIKLQDVLQIGLQISKALVVAHRAGIVHRDIKPENIMVRTDGYAKLVDFGLARLVPADMLSAETTLTSSDAISGTVIYMSPEQLRGEAVESPSDIFSFGIVLYEMATARHPFQAQSTAALISRLLTRPPVPASEFNPEIPAELSDLIAHMLEKDFHHRPTAPEVEQILETLAPTAVVSKPYVAPRSRTGSRHFVDREREQEQLLRAYEAVKQGRGNMVCIGAEAGLGKTTLVEEFLDHIAPEDCLIGRGRCSERLAGAKGYLPVIEAMESLLRNDSTRSFAEAAKLWAPTWYAEIARGAGASPEPAATSQERMKREMAQLFEHLSRLRTLVLFIDDTQWADLSTVDLLAYLASKFDTLRTLALCTYRSSELHLSEHAFLELKLDLQTRGLCQELQLRLLTEQDISAYLDLEFPEHKLPPVFATLLAQRTEGSPLFMVDLIRYLRDRNVIAQESGNWTLTQELPDIGRELPQSVRSMIQRKIERLSPAERRLLSVASVQGYELDSAVLAAALAMDAAEIEETLQRLENTHFFVQSFGEGELPDRTLTMRYRFVHILYQNALYAALTPARRVSTSRAVAEALLRHYGKEHGPIAANLGFLFESARDFPRAADFFLLAANHAASIFANQEAVLLANRSLEMLKDMAEGLERDRKELAVLTSLGPVLIATAGFASPEVEKAYLRARQLCSNIPGRADIFPVLFGLWSFYEVRGQLQTCLDVAHQMLKLAKELGDPALYLEAQYAVGDTLFWLGDFAGSREQLEAVLKQYNKEEHHSLARLHGGYDPGVASLIYLAWDLWQLGFPEQAAEHCRKALHLAEELRHPFSRAVALSFAACFHQFRQEEVPAREYAQAALALSEQHGFETFTTLNIVVEAWSASRLDQAGDSPERIQAAIQRWRSAGAELMYPHFTCLLTETLQNCGRAKEGRPLLDSAIAAAATTGEGFYDPELHRLKGELLLDSISRSPAQASGHPLSAEAAASPQATQAEACFRAAIESARRHNARILELRASISLGRLLHSRGQSAEAASLVFALYHQFTEGLETFDLQAARALLDSWSAEACAGGK